MGRLLVQDSARLSLRAGLSAEIGALSAAASAEMGCSRQLQAEKQPINWACCAVMLTNSP